MLRQNAAGRFCLPAKTMSQYHARQTAAARVERQHAPITCADGTIRRAGADPYAGAYQEAADALRVRTAEVVECRSWKHANAVMDGHANGHITRVAVSPVPPALRELENRAHDPVARIRRERRDNLRWNRNDLRDLEPANTGRN